MSNELINLTIGFIFGAYATTKIYRIIDKLYGEVENGINKVKGMVS